MFILNKCLLNNVAFINIILSKAIGRVVQYIPKVINYKHTNPKFEARFCDSALEFCLCMRIFIFPPQNYALTIFGSLKFQP